jgi:hypothetical protein
MGDIAQARPNQGAVRPADALGQRMLVPSRCAQRIDAAIRDDGCPR